MSCPAPRLSFRRFPCFCARARLEAALAAFEEACRALAVGGTVDSSIFGSISVEDYAMFQALHTRHHCRQMPGHGNLSAGV